MKTSCVAAILLAAAPLEQPQAHTAENAALRLEVSPDNGAIVGLYDKRTRTEYIADTGNARLFELLIPDANNYSRRIVSAKQRPASVDSNGTRIEVRFTQLKPDEEQYSFGSGLLHVAEPVLDIEAHVTLELENDHIVASLRLENRSLVTITGVVFPFVAGMPLESGGAQATVMLPSVSRRRFAETRGALSGQKALRYPGMVASSWLNYEFTAQDPQPARSLGLEVRSGLEAQDAYFSLSSGPFRRGSAYRGRYEFPFIGWIHYPHLSGHGTWTSPPATLHVHAQDWHAIAAEHREWYRAAAHPQPARARRMGLGVATYLLKSDDNTARWDYRELPVLAGIAAQAGMQHLVVDGWREREGPSNPAPFGEIADPRLGGAIALRRAIDTLHRQDTELLFTFHPTLMNVTQGRVPAELGSWAVKTRRQGNQLPVDFLYHTFDYPDAIDTASYRVEIDPASAAGPELLRAAQRLASDYGVRSLLLEGVGQQAFLSYNRHHGVSPQNVYAVGYPRLLGALRSIYADGLLLTEGCNDLVNPLVDGAYTWDQSSDPAVLAYSLPWSAFSNDVEAMDYAAANIAFAHGLLLNLIVDGGQGTVADYPQFARHLRGLRDLKAAAAPYYVDAEFRDHDGLSELGNDAGILTAVFVNAAAGKTGIVVANLNDATAVAHFDLARPAGSARARVLPQGRKTDVLSGPIELQLAPHEVRLLAIEGTLRR